MEVAKVHCSWVGEGAEEGSSGSLGIDQGIVEVEAVEGKADPKPNMGEAQVAGGMEEID